MSLTLDEKRALLQLARCSLNAIADAQTTLEHALRSITVTPAMRLRAGAFVSLHERVDGRLRGCIGWLESRFPLVTAVYENTRAAALQDPRFPPMSAAETSGVEIELSVLGPLEPVDDPVHIVVGRDGVAIEQASKRGVLLPQVAVQAGWTRDELLDAVCRKAGLSPGSWKHGAALQRFEAEVFGEGDFDVGNLDVG